jgi:hypothetical protein
MRAANLDLLAPASDGDAPAVRAARAFLDGGALDGALPDDVADALVEALARRGDADRLGALAAGRDKAMAKRARRGLHLLRTRGVRAEIPVAAAPARAVPAAEPEATSLISGVLRDGERLVTYARAHEEGVEVWQAQITETEGLVRFEMGVIARKRWREMEHEMLSDPVLHVARVPGAVARWLLEDSYQRALDLGCTPPRRYAEVRHQLEKGIPPGTPPGVDATTLPADGLERVLALPEAASWIPDEQVAQKLWLELQELALSRLVLDERQRTEQAKALIARACGEALAGPWRARLARRLEETAWLIAATPARAGEGRDRIVDAALCLAAARQVADTSLPPETIVVARGLFDRLAPAEIPTQAPPDEKPGGPLIITP